MSTVPWLLHDGQHHAKAWRICNGYVFWSFFPDKTLFLSFFLAFLACFSHGAGEESFAWEWCSCLLRLHLLHRNCGFCPCRYQHYWVCARNCILSFYLTQFSSLRLRSWLLCLDSYLKPLFGPFPLQVSSILGAQTIFCFIRCGCRQDAVVRISQGTTWWRWWAQW